jgi:hypothetical protein
LPANPAVGDLIQVSGVGAGGFKILQNAGQQVYVGFENTLWVPRSSPFILGQHEQHCDAASCRVTLAAVLNIISNMTNLRRRNSL